MHRVTEQIQRMQGNDLTVLITGESGTGKDLVARAIHAGSPRRGGDGPMIVAAHPVAPIADYMKQWRADLEWLADLCARENVIVAGDFNATVDHMSAYAVDGQLGNCHDGALAHDAAAVGTWPTFLPPLLGAPIDHVMATGEWQFTGMRVIESRDDQGSDHRPVLAQLRPAG